MESKAGTQCLYIEIPEKVDVVNAERIAYNEDEMIQEASINDKEARLTPHHQYTFIENLVALTKHFHQSYFKESGGQWFFAQLLLEKPFNNESELVLILHKNMGSRLTQSKIFQNDREIGEIYFSYHK